MKYPYSSLFVGALIVSAVSSRAGVTTLNLNPATYELISFNMNRDSVNYKFTPSELIGFDLTTYAGDSGTQILNTQGAPNVPIGQRAALLDDDLRFDTGVINPARNATAVRIDFDAPVVNRAGEDIVMFEWNASGGGDAFQVRANGTTVQYTALDYSAQLFGPVPVRAQQLSTPGTLTALENNAITGGFNISQNIFSISSCC